MAVFSAGHILTAADFDALFPTGIAAWTGYTPTLTQSATVTKTVNRAAYMKVGRTVKVNGYLSVTSAGTAANNVSVGLPVAPSADLQVGSAYILDTSTSTRYICTCLTFGGVLIFQHDTSGLNNFGVTPAVTLANGDAIAYSIEYEAAA